MRRRRRDGGQRGVLRHVLGGLGHVAGDRGLRRGRGEDEVRLVGRVGRRVGAVSVADVVVRVAERSVGVCVRVGLRVGQGQGEFDHPTPSPSYRVCVIERQRGDGGVRGVRREGRRGAGVASLSHAVAAVAVLLLAQLAVRGSGRGPLPRAFARRGHPVKGVVATVLGGGGHGGHGQGRGLVVVAVMMVVGRRRLLRDSGASAAAVAMAILGVQSLDLGGSARVGLAEGGWGGWGWPPCGWRGHRCRVVGSGGDERAGGAFGSTIAKQAPQEGTATPCAAPTRAPAAATAGEGAPMGHRPPCGVVKLPRPTPHPRSGAQDGAVRPVVFKAVGDAPHHEGALLGSRAANDGPLEEGEVIQKVGVGTADREDKERRVLSKRARSEERRVGKECLRLCRSRWSPYH